MTHVLFLLLGLALGTAYGYLIANLDVLPSRRPQAPNEPIAAPDEHAEIVKWPRM